MVGSDRPCRHLFRLIVSETTYDVNRVRFRGKSYQNEKFRNSLVTIMHFFLNGEELEKRNKRKREPITRRRRITPLDPPINENSINGSMPHPKIRESLNLTGNDYPLIFVGSLKTKVVPELPDLP